MIDERQKEPAMLLEYQRNVYNVGAHIGDVNQEENHNPVISNESLISTFAMSGNSNLLAISQVHLDPSFDLTNLIRQTIHLILFTQFQKYVWFT